MDKIPLRPIIPSEMVPPLKPLLVNDLEGLSLLEDFLKRTSVYGLDLETNVVDNFTERRIRTIQIGDKNEQYVIDLLAFAGTTEKLISGQDDFGRNAESVFGDVLKVIRPSLEDKAVTKVGHNLQFEYEALRYNLGIRLCGLDDLMRAEQNIYAGIVPFKMSGFWALDDLVGRYCGLLMSKDEQKGFDLSKPLTESQIVYGALDVRLPMAVRNGQLKTLAAEGLTKAAWIDSNAIPAFGDMHLHGVFVDPKKWTALIDENERLKKRIIAKLDTLAIPIVGRKIVTQADRDAVSAAESAWKQAGSRTVADKEKRKAARAEFYSLRRKVNDRIKLSPKCEGEAAINYASQLQVLNLLRSKGYSKKELPDTNDRSLEKLAKFRTLTVEQAFERSPELDYPVIDLFRLFRTVDKLLSTYGHAWIQSKREGGHVNPLTGRIHSNINLFGADTGRASSSSPNIQNLPSNTLYRHAFTARPGYKVLTIDYNGAELRILAEMSQEPVWLNAFAKGWDVHSVGAEILYGQEWINAAEPGCAYFAKKEKCKCAGHKDLRNRVKAVDEVSGLQQ